MIRKFIICLLIAVFSVELYQLTFYDIEPRTSIASISFIVSIFLLGRMFLGIMIVEHWMGQHGSGMDKD
jgi:hypothetical protein